MVSVLERPERSLEKKYVRVAHVSQNTSNSSIRSGITSISLTLKKELTKHRSRKENRSTTAFVEKVKHFLTEFPAENEELINEALF